MKKQFAHAAAAAILLLALAARGQAPATAPAAPASTAADWNKTIAPFIDDDTFAIAHADVSKFDSAAITNYLLDIMDAAKVPADDQERKEMAAGLLVAGDFATKFTRYGGRDLFAVWDHSDAMNLSGPAFLIPIASNGNAAAMTELLKSTFGTGGMQVSALRDGLLVLAQDATLKRIQSIKPAPRPKLQFAGGRPDLFATVVVSPTADERRALAELLPALPPDFGGASTEWLSRDVDNLTLQITLPPKPHAELTFVYPMGVVITNGLLQLPQPSSPAQSINGFFKSFRESTEFKDFLQSQIAGPDADQLRTLLTDILNPQPTLSLEPYGTALTLSDSQIQSFETAMFRDQMRALAASRNAESQANIKGLLVTCFTYASKNHDQWPESLDLLVKDKQISERQLISPNDPKKRPYVYERITGSPADASLPIIWEQTDDSTAPRNVGYADGHVALRSPEGFQQDLRRLADFRAAHATTRPAQAPGAP